jgi:hypothetical protein
MNLFKYIKKRLSEYMIGVRFDVVVSKFESNVKVFPTEEVLECRELMRKYNFFYSKKLDKATEKLHLLELKVENRLKQSSK